MGCQRHLTVLFLKVFKLISQFPGGETEPNCTMLLSSVRSPPPHDEHTIQLCITSALAQN